MRESCQWHSYLADLIIFLSCEVDVLRYIEGLRLPDTIHTCYGAVGKKPLKRFLALWAEQATTCRGLPGGKKKLVICEMPREMFMSKAAVVAASDLFPEDELDQKEHWTWCSQGQR